jgi:glycosyltransferase involved in cell wall biosynthesis
MRPVFKNKEEIQIDTVSVCIPTYNGSQYLQETIESVLLQTYQNLEIVIVDDNSTDNTIEIARNITQGNPNVKIYQNVVRQGLGGNWNKCLEVATGEWIKFVFQDDLLSPGCIEKLHDLATRTNNVLAVCGRVFSFEENVPASFREIFLQYVDINSISNRFPHHDRVICAKDFAAHALQYPVFNCIGEPTAVLFHHSTTSRFGCFNIDLSQIIDWEYWMRVAINTGLCFTDEKLVTFRLHNKGTTAKNRSDDGNVLLAMIEELIVYHEQVYNTNYATLYKINKYDFFTPNKLLTMSRLANQYSSIQSTRHQYPENMMRNQLIEKYRLKENGNPVTIRSKLQCS